MNSKAKTDLMRKENIEDVFPMSDIQVGMMYHSLKDPQAAVYHGQGVYVEKVKDFDPGIFRKTIELLVEKHPMLRTGFNISDFKEPVQIVFKTVTPDLDHVDLTHMDQSQQEQYLRSYLAEDQALSFNLKVPALLWRMSTFTLDQDTICFIWSRHHAVTDGWSAAALITELNNTYIKLKSNPHYVPRKLKNTYKQYVLEQRHLKKNKKTRAFWQKELDGYKRLNFPGLGGHESKNSQKNTYARDLGKELREQLNQVAAQYHISFKNLCFAAYIYMLGMLSYDGELVVGLVTNNRPICEDGDKIIGCFLNTVPVRILIPAQLKWQDYIRLVDKKLLELTNYNQLSLMEIVKCVNEETGGHNPIFDTLFNFVDFHIYSQINQVGLPESSSDKNERKVSAPGGELTNTLLDCSVLTTSGEFIITFNYKSSRLNRQLIENLAGYFEAVLKKFVHQLQDIVDREELIPGIERRKLLYEFNKTDAEYPQNKTIHQLFAEQVGKVPDAIAFGADISITYKELNRRSNQLAYLLQEKGVKPDTIVAIMLENSIELIIAILGILQAGGAYLPIDPDYPRERIRYMLADSRVNILVKNSHGVDNPAIEHQLFVLDFQHLNFEFVSNFDIRISDLNASNLSYIIYTSGSTGKPKGTLIENRNVVRLLFNDQFQFDFSSSDVWTLFHSCCFDFSVWEMYGALLYGGKLILIPKMMARNPDDFRELLKQEAVTVLNQTPAAFYHLANLETKIPGKDLKLRYVIFGGEPLAPARLKEWKEKYPGTKLINMYGITETTVHVTYKEIELEDIRLSISNIGKPIPTLSAYVVDRNQKLVPIGVAGELCVGGQGVCRGYLNRPQLTAEKFCLRQPGGMRLAPGALRFAHSPRKNFLLKGTRGLAPLLYRSGDLVRRLENGEMEYLGRIDQQVKVRGYRIEPGEIEKLLLNHDEINEAVVTARKNTSANQWELIAYIISPRSFETPGLRDYLSGHLPDYMIPSYFLQLETIPLTPNGKIDRKTLALQGKELNSGVDYAPPQGELEKTVANTWMEILGVKKIGIDENFFEIGGDSLRAVQLSNKLNTVLSTDISIVELFEYVTVRSFVRYLQEKQGKKGTSENNMNRSAVVRPGQVPQNEQDRPKSMGIAVIGMSGKFPGAKNIQEFWDNLKNGVEAISFLSGQELQDARVDPVVLTDPNYVKTSGGIFTAREYFDAAFFEYTPLEAELLNPQVRVFHECVWESLEDAGYVPDSHQGSIGIYAGATTSFHWEGITLLSGKKEELGLFTGSLLANKDYLSTRIAYRFNLSGPAVTVNTACSTSLVAVHLACRAIWAGECDMALAGGACIVSRPLTGYLYQQGMIASQDGHCRAFDENASGTASGNGAGVVVLKPLANAIADRDHIYAVIKGTAINNDGITKSNFTAPSRKAQTKVIQMAHQDAGVTAESIGYVEAHGTGTPIGDPIEVAALCQAFATNRDTPCAIGSVKTNIGHLDAAAGIAGLIKTILSLKHRLIPPNLHYEKPNPKIDFENSPFYVNTTLSPWETNKKTLRAGVSAFGLGGTNAHVVLEEAPPAGESVNQWVSESVVQHVSDSVGQLGNEQGTVSRGGSLCPPPETGSREYQLILLSAKTPSALQRMTENLGEYLKKNPGINLADMAYTLDVGRKVWPHRRLLVGSTVEEAIAALTSPGSALLHTHHWKPGDKDRAVIFMFPGQGSQFVDMGLELYRSETLFREHMDRCFKILKPLMGHDTRDILYPFSRSHRSDINQTEIAQPVLFAFEYALAKLLMTWGITPDAMIGHSIGEYVAAHLSGVFSLEDGLKLAAARGRLMQQMPPGAMLSVPLPEQQLIPLLNQQLSLAAVNGPDLCVVSGPLQTVASFEKQMENQGYDCRRLHTSHAFHSTMMEPILAEFKKEVARVTRNKPKIPYISGLSGNWTTAAQAADPGYWARHLRETVRFNRGLEKLFNWKQCLCLELGPGNVLSSLVKRFTQQQPDRKTIHFVRHPQEKVSDLRFLLNKIGELWFYGKPVHWSGFYAQQERHRVPLPTYPFQGQRYWIDEASLPVTPEAWARRSLSKKKQDIAAWFYFPLWKQSGPDFSNDNGSKSPDQLRWLVFTDNLGLGKRLQELLRQKKQRIISVTAGEAFTRINDTEYMIDPGQANHYISLFSQLLSAGDIPNTILHLWNVTGTSTRDYSVEWVKQAQDYGYFSLLYQAQAIGKLNISDKIQIMMVTDKMQEVTGEEDLCPEKATLLGPAKVVPQEYRNISCRCIDITCPKNGNWQDTALTDRLLTEFQTLSPDTIVAYRGNYRWIQIYEPLTGKKTQNHREIGNQLRNKGVYLVIGGLGGVGRVWARYLAASVKARLVLTGRSAFPPRSRWEQWVSTHPKNHRTSQQIRAIQELEKMGAAVLVMQADAADPKQMHQVLHRAEETFGPLNGVIHCAGIIGEKTVLAVGNTDRSHTMTQFYPKVDGLLVLEKILRDKPLDFCLQMSSLASVLGGLGFTAYTAANTFIDSFVRRHNQSNPIRWTSINWDAWEFRPPGKISAANKKNTHEFFILPEEGTKAFEYILSWRNTSQIVISTGELQTRINQWLTFETEDEEPEPREAQPASGYGREHLSTTYLAPGNPLQQEIVHLWQKFFGIHPIGINDDFFKLGGDSLTAVTIARKLHQHLNVVVPLAEFFNRPTIKELAQYIQHAERKTYSTINPVGKKEYHVLSSAQKRLYILQQMESKSIAYNQYHVALLEGKPDREKLQRTFKALIQRHETLRSAIFMVSAKPVQKVYDEVEFVIDDYKPKNLKLPWSESCLPALARDFVRPFDLSHPPLFRVGLIKIGDQQHILVIDMHHLVTDGVSFGIFVKELGAIYGGQELQSLKLQYKDYSEWQNTQIQQEFINNQEKYWLDRFQEEIPVLHLPTDYPRPAVQSFEGNSLKFEINCQEAEKLKKLAQEQDATLFMVTLALVYIFLAKLSGQEDIVIGSPVACRRHLDLQYIMGIFINTLALRDKPNGKKTFRTFLKEVKENALKAFENQEYPFEDLIDIAEVDRDISRNPLFDIMFVLQNVEIEAEMIPEVRVPDLKWKFLEYENKHAKFDLTLTAVETREKLVFELQYGTKLFKKETIQRYITYFKQLAASVSETPENRISDIDMVPQKEKQQLLEAFSSGIEVFYPKDKTLYRLFEEQAEKTPYHTALVGQIPKSEIRNRANNKQIQMSNIQNSKQEGTRGLAPLYISYRELNKRSNQLAYLLKEKGVKPDTIVGLMIERSIEMMIGVWGILKSGAAYLPIDPDYPRERIRYMLTDSKVNILVKNSNIFSDLEKEQDLFVLNFEHLNFEFVCHSNDLDIRISDLNASNLSYIIYTSGSTGRPKGTPIDYGNVNNYTGWFKKEFDITGEDRFAFTGSFCFDMSVTSLLVPLVSGASLWTTRDKIERDPWVYTCYLSRSKISIIKLTPTQFKPLLDLMEEIDLGSLRYIILGGEAVDVKDVQVYLSCYSRQSIVNEYGPTEATVATVFYVAAGSDVQPTRAGLPIGRPIFNTRVYILDRYAAPVPIGVAGELYIGGQSVSRGYLNNPELTSEKFGLRRPGERFLKKLPPWTPRKNFLLKIAPLSSEFYPGPCAPGFRLYKSGDLVRWLPDGNIEYLGRIDTQIKIKGYRIELEEIEAVLTAHEGVHAGVVAGKKDPRGNLTLVGFIILKHGATTTGVKEYLKQRLPAYMVPALVAAVEELPLAVSGKIDRKKLPGLSDLQLTGSEAFRETALPSGEKEKLLVDTWKQVLGVPHVGVHHHFFELGGDSIKAIQVAARLRKARFQLAVNDIFLHPYIKELKKYLEKIDRSIDQGIVTGEVVLTPVQRWFFERYYSSDNNDFTALHHFNQSVMIYREGGFDCEAVEQVFTQILFHHDALRMVYPLKNGTVRQWNKAMEGKPFHLETIDLRGIDTGFEIEIEAAASGIQEEIDLANGPLVRLGLFKTNQGDHLLIVIHHLVVDGVSWRILQEDFALGYRQVINHQPVTFQEKTDSFQYWTMKLKEYAGSAQALKELEYWKTIKDTKNQRLPTDHAISPHQKQRRHRNTITMTLPGEDTEKLLRRVNRAYNTEINDILLAALGLALKDWAGIHRVLIDLEGHGREEILPEVSISRTVGWFTTRFPVALDLNCTAGLSYFIKLVKETLRKIPHRGIGYGILRYLTEEKAEDIAVEPPISFNYLGEFGQESDSKSAAFEFSRLKTGNPVNPQLKESHQLDINGMVTGGRLVLSFDYNKYEYEGPTIDQLVESYGANLREIIRHCTGKQQVELTPSDLDYQVFTIDDLSAFENKIRETAGEIENIYRLSPMQSGMFYHYLANEDAYLYFEQYEISLQGEIDGDLLEKSLNLLLQRYDVLRTIFVQEGCPEPLQIVMKQRYAPVHFVDISNLTGKSLNNDIESLKQEDRDRGFDLASDVLIRTVLIKTGSDSYKVIWSFHHIIMDGWCIGIIFKDLVNIYVSLRENRPIQLETATPYSEYLKWLQGWSKKNARETWKEYLEGYEQPIGLPKYSDPDKNVEYRMEKYQFVVDKELTAHLVMLANENQVTINTIMQTLWGILLQKLNQVTDVVFGQVVSGRPPIEDVEHMVGLFINTIPIRIKLEKEIKTFCQLARHVQQQALLTQSHQYLPLAEIESCSPLKNKLSDHIMIFENYPVQEELGIFTSTNPSGFEIVDVEVFEQTNYHFNLMVVPGKTISITFFYNSRVYDSHSIKKTAFYFKEIIKQVKASGNIEVKDIQLIGHDPKPPGEVQLLDAAILEEARGEFGF